jgi:hypothetical protein
MIYGYARVSTDGQSVAAQVKELRAAGAEKVFARRRAALKPTAHSSAGVHARQNGESSRRRQSEIAFGPKRGGVALIGRNHFVSDFRHSTPLP